MILLYICAGLFILYSILILYYRSGWRELKPFASTKNEYQTTISVIVAARNEEENIARLLHSIDQQSYPKNLYEVIVVDDHSTDNTAAIVKDFPFVKLIPHQFDNINSYKKKAIETGIAAAAGDLIVTTDADCIVHEDWLKTIAAFKEQTNAVLIAAPVVIECNWNILQTFQSLDFLMLQGITAASVKKQVHNMCNGANLTYERKVFYEVRGFKDIDQIASGDDMLLMQKIDKRFPGKTSYLLSEEAIVVTKPVKTWGEFFSQRIRWASKATNYTDLKIFSVLFLVYFFNVSLFAMLVAGFWNHNLWWGLLAIVFAKTLIELSFVHPVAKFYKQERLLNLFPLFQPMHILYTIIAGWLGTFGSYKWKGRQVK